MAPNPRIREKSSNIALTKNGEANPANSKRKPPINGPGTVAMLATELVTPNILPCSLSLVALEMKLGNTVLMIPLPVEIKVSEKKLHNLKGS